MGLDPSQELGNQLNEARQVVHAIRAGGDAGLAEGIKNPDIRERVQESAHSGMSVVDANVLNQEMSRAASTRREDVSSEISMQIRAIAEEQRNNRAPAINCAPGA